MSVRPAPERLDHAGAARDGWGLALVLVLAVTVSWVIFERVIRAGPLLDWDEAYHSLWGLLIADDLVHSRFVSLLVDTNRQVYWAPLHSWYLAPLFIVFGPSTVLARSSSLLAFVATAVVVYFTARLLTRSAGPGGTAAGGVVAATCLIVSGGVQGMVSAAMLEVPALFWLAVCFWFYLRCRSGASSERWPSVLLGLAVLATYLMRASYGVLIALALTVALLVDGRWLSRRRSAAPGGDEAELAARRRGQALTALALGLPLAVWLAYPGKIRLTLAALISAPYGPERFSLDGLLFYPRAMLWLAGSWPLLVVWMLALLLTLRSRVLASNAGLRLIVIFLAWQMLFAELAVAKVERYGLPLALGLSLLAGFWAGRGWIRLWQWRVAALGRRLPSVAAWVVLAGVAVLVAWQVLGMEVSGAGRGIARRAGPLLEHLVDDLRRNGPCLLVGSADLSVSPAGIDWHLAAAGLLPMEGAGALVTPADLYSIHSRPGRLRRILPDSVRGQVDRWPGAAGTYTAYVGLPPGSDEPVKFSPSNFGERMAALLVRHPMDRVLVILRDGSSLTPELVTEDLRGLGFAATEPSPRQIHGARASVIEFKAIRAGARASALVAVAELIDGWAPGRGVEPTFADARRRRLLATRTSRRTLLPGGPPVNQFRDSH